LAIQGELAQVRRQFVLGIIGEFGQRRTGAVATYDGIFGLIKGGTAGMVGPRLAPPSKQKQL
jgi:hypothetical protein